MTPTPKDLERARELVGDELFNIVSEAAHYGMSQPVKRASLARIATETLITVISRGLAEQRERSAQLIIKTLDPDINGIAKALAQAIRRGEG